MNIKTVKKSFVIYSVVAFALIGSAFEAYKQATKTEPVVKQEVIYSQPQLPAATGSWKIQSVDTQVISKHWPNVSREAIQEQVKLLKDLGVNYIGIGTPYDKVEEMQMWADEIHAAGLHVWFRSHWAEWEGDEGLPATLSPEEYLKRTGRFIKANPTLFKPGDSFTVAVEPENVGVGLGKRFLTWDEYRGFLLGQMTVANSAFDEIGLKNHIFTNWISVNGWIVENQFTPEFTKKLGLITVDHYVGQKNTIGDYGDTTTIVNMTISDLDRYYKKFGVPILLGEWGFQIFQSVPDDIQAEVVEKMFEKLKTRDYLVGVSYWTHMGNSASIIGDEFGSNLKYREAAFVIKRYFDPLSLIDLP